MTGLLPGGTHLCPACKGAVGVNCSCGPTWIGGVDPSQIVPGTPIADPCGPGEGNEPVESEDLRCSVGVTMQPHVDAARRQVHALGLRPYRVYLVWEEQQRDQTWKDIKRVELVPVEVEALDSVDLELSEIGIDPDGAIRLSQISPALVSEHDLLGKLDGESISRSDPDVRFFYEVVKHARCAGDPPPVRRRYIPGGEPSHRASSFEWTILLVDNAARRGPDGEDRTFVRDDVPDVGGKVARLRR